MLLAKFMTRLRKNMVTEMLLLRFQMCAVANRVAVLHLRTANPECRVSSRSQTDQPNLSVTTSRILLPPAQSRSLVQLAANSTHRQNALLFSTFPITEERSLSAVTLRIHASAGAATIAVQLASKRDIAKALQEQQVEFGTMRRLLSNTRASDMTAATTDIK